MGVASDLRASLEGLPASELLPPRLRASEPFRGQPVVRDVLVLPGACVLAVFQTEDEGQPDRLKGDYHGLGASVDTPPAHLAGRPEHSSLLSVDVCGP
jgi:hypothetical protein